MQSTAETAQRLPGDERLAGVVLVEPFSIENGLLTQTLKQRRDRITARDSRLIEILYGRGNRD